jgi:hypothetical protein
MQIAQRKNLPCVSQWKQKIEVAGPNGQPRRGATLGASGQ